jgi:hypothetical protein
MHIYWVKIEKNNTFFGGKNFEQNKFWTKKILDGKSFGQNICPKSFLSEIFCT